MTTYNVPHTFIPGTKAKANEVNENFATVLEHIATTKENSADINLSNLTDDAKELIRNVSGTGKLIGELVFSSLPITDACVHLLDGAIIEGDGIYKDFVKYIAELYNSDTDIPAYFITEEDWQTSITNYGVCGKFVYDADNNTVRLPKITGIVEGTIDLNALGSLVEAGLPNITGQFHSTDNAGWANGAFTYQGTSGMGHWNSDDGQHTITFNASNSSKIYGKSNTVQPQTIKQFVYIVIANSKKTEIVVDIDNIASDLNNKTNLDLSNITNEAKVLMSGMGMPINRYTDLTLASSGTKYTAPASGWFYIRKGAGATGNWLNIGVNPHYISCTAPSSNAELTVIYPVRKGYDVTVSYQATGATGLFRFVYAEGSRNEV